MRAKILTILIMITISLSICGVSYSAWTDNVKISGQVVMACWKGCIRIRKTLEGAFTDPYTGLPIEEPTNLIAIAASFPTRFRLVICIVNCGSTKLTNVVVTDTIKNNMAPREWYPTEGVSWEHYAPGGGEWDGVHFAFNELTWDVGSLDPDETKCLEIWIETLQNENNKYEPTSGDEGDSQELENNEGATVTAKSPLARLSATTEAITLMVVDDDIPENGIGKIQPVLPYLTPWETDRYP